MPSQPSKRTKRANEATSPDTGSDIENMTEIESVSVISDGREVLPIDQDNSSTPSIKPSPSSNEPTNISASSKKRKAECLEIDSDYEAVGMKKGNPQDRNPTEMPLIVTNSTGKAKVLWAQMDTGADMNIIAEKLVAKLGFSRLIEPVSPTSGTTEATDIGGKSIDIDRKISITFTAGRKNIICKDVEFRIPRQDVVDTDQDGLPDVLLGLPELLKYHMITVDPDFCNEPEEGLEILAKRAIDETNRPVWFLMPTKWPQAKVEVKTR